MWQEARKQEKKLRCIMIDYKKRAERRQAYYARMRMDPHQLMRVYGQKCKFHIIADNSKISNADGQLMPWQGDPEVMIDRFDVRAHLDYIPEETNKSDLGSVQTPEEEKFQRKCSYERYRTLVQIDATGASEEQYLKQLELEEGVGRSEMEKKRLLENDKISSKATAKFHYKYEDSTDILDKGGDSSGDDDDSDDSDSDGDLSDIDINVNVLDLNEDQTNHLDALATQYGIGYGQYCKQLLLEKKEFEYVKKLEEEEEERAKMPGRKGKSARRSLRAKQKTLRGSPLSFALHESSPQEDEDRAKRDGSVSSDSSSHSKTPVDSKVEFITSFGGEEDSNDKNGSEIIIPPSTPRKKSSEYKNSHHKHSRHRSSRSRSHGKTSGSQDHKSRDRHQSRSRSRERHKSHHSSSKSRERHKSSHSRHSSSSKSKGESYSERSNSSYSSAHRSRSRSPKNSSSYRSRSRSPKYIEDSSRNSSRGDKSRDRSRRRSRSRSMSNTSYGKESSRRRSRSKSREKRSKSPHGTIVKRLGTDTTPNPVVDKSNLTPREKMKLRMQKLLNRQIKSDKKEEHKKQVAKEQEIEERDMEIYEMSRMLRMKEREKRVYRSPSPKGHMPCYDASRF